MLKHHNEEFCCSLLDTLVSGSPVIQNGRIIGAVTGLGLAISSMVVQKHGGRLYIEDNIGSFTKGFVMDMKRC